MRTPLDPYSQVGAFGVHGLGKLEHGLESVILMPPTQQRPQEQREQLQALRQAAFESEGESLGTGLSADRRRSLCAREFRKLGFSVSDPSLTPHPCLSTELLWFQRPGALTELPVPLPPEQQPRAGSRARAPWPAGPGQHALLLQTRTQCLQPGQ